MAKDRKRKAPSRIRYEESHPVMSCRVSKDIYDRLERVRDIEGISFSDILKIGLGIMEPIAEKNGDNRRSSYEMGRQAGYVDAKSLFEVTYPCAVCGQLITVSSDGEKEAIREFMQQRGWGHTECHRTRR